MVFQAFVSKLLATLLFLPSCPLLTAVFVAGYVPAIHDPITYM